MVARHDGVVVAFIDLPGLMTRHAPLPIARETMGVRQHSQRQRSSLTAFTRAGRLFAAIGALAGSVLLYGFLLSGDFLISSVVVEGARLGDPAEIVAVAATIDEPVFAVDAAAAAERVAMLPYVARAAVSTRYPNKVTITVVERVPVAVWESGGRAYLVDASGYVLIERMDGSLPLVVDGVGQPGVGVQIEAADVAAVVAIHEAFTGRAIGLSRTRTDGFVVALGEQTVVLGGAEGLPKKLAVWQSVATLDGTWQLLDLREPDRPYYK